MATPSATMHRRASRLLDFLDFQYLTTEFGLVKEFLGQRRKGVFLYFDVILCGNEFLGLKQENSH
jgi:hypothetical protein